MKTTATFLKENYGLIMLLTGVQLGWGVLQHLTKRV